MSRVRPLGGSVSKNRAMQRK